MISLQAMQPLPAPADDRELREVRDREVTGARKWLASSGGRDAGDKEVGPKAPKAAKTRETGDEEDAKNPPVDPFPLLLSETDKRVLRSASRRAK